MSNIKDVRCKPRLHNSFDLLAGLWPPCCTLSYPYGRVHALVINATSYIDFEKRVALFPFSMHACDSVLIVIVVRLQPFGLPELRYYINIHVLYFWLSAPA